ncbi:hypothetical protein GCM10010425_53900 [Streptomyces spororaveus]|uniref:Uncharacterized protein n=1 Tax=Streptomyces spororaveus TaxID=284039 RepID=A0ABQ3T3Z8_9ACTN|nr:hypothetical protein Sspor_06310 [Streptomyces spororaveus]
MAEIVGKNEHPQIVAGQHGSGPPHWCPGRPRDRTRALTPPATWAGTVIPWTTPSVIKYRPVSDHVPPDDQKEASAVQFTIIQRSLPVSPVWFV